MGLAAVIINTALVTIASFATAMAADRTILFLQPARSKSMADSRWAKNADAEDHLVAARRNVRDLDRY
jgi:hypothetical protein